MPRTQIVWFKRDLRVTDHLPLFEAAKSGPTIGLYIYEPELILAADFSARHLVFINQSLRELRDSLRHLGSELILRTGEAVSVLEQLRHEWAIAGLWAHEETTNWVSYQRDRRVRAWAKQTGVRFVEYPQYGVVRRLPNRDGWADEWESRMNGPLTPTPERLACPTAFGSLTTAERGAIREPSEFGLAKPDGEQQTGGPSEAQRCLSSFLNERGHHYRTGMSSPVTAFEQCSRLSPYLAYGNVSLRTIYQETRDRQCEAGDDANRSPVSAGDSDRPVLMDGTWRQSLASFQSRLRWHCHFMQKMEDQPEMEFENVNAAYNGLREDEFDREKFRAWCEGRTGYPMVDACMRALQQTGWINFRMRAMLVSFAAYHLWLHWREPALHLARLFLDYEPGIHYSQIQMQAGVTGINTVRIYSPIKQVADQDPEGAFIRRFVPELAEVPTHRIAEPHRLTLLEQSLYGCRIGTDYPAPIVDHATAYRSARDRIFHVKRSTEARVLARGVQQKLGSRRRNR